MCDRVLQRPLEMCVWDPRAQSMRYACVITTVVVVMEEGGTQKILAHAGLTYDPECLVAPIRSLPPSGQPFFLHLLSTSIPSFPLWGSSLAHMEVWGSSWLSAKKGSGGRGVDEGKREGSIENRKIDLIYEFSVTFGTDLHVFDFSSRFDKLVIDLSPCIALAHLNFLCVF